METEEQDIGASEELPEDPEELDDDDDLGDDVEDDSLPPVVEDESDEDSLEELLEGRATARRGTDDAEDEDDIMSLASEREETARLDIPPSKITPVKDQQEFVCNRCHLVKAKVQLADEERGLCRDCV